MKVDGTFKVLLYKTSNFGLFETIGGFKGRLVKKKKIVRVLAICQ
jgi:hypothetical protein